jgi:hypothetical protein
MFPATITYEKTVKYQLVGVVMCLNDGQSEGTLGFTGVLSSYLPNTKSEDTKPIKDNTMKYVIIGAVVVGFLILKNKDI